MTTLFCRYGRLRGAAAAATLTLALLALSLHFGASASAATLHLGASAGAATLPCSDDTDAPTGPATVSAAWIAPYGKVLVIGSGPYSGCSVYLLTSDQLHALSGAPYACSDGTNPLNEACDTGLWPAVVTKGAPIAGPGVDPSLLGTVTRTDLSPLVGSVQQVTYAGYPLYRFFQDTAPGDTQGANLDDPVTSPPGIWYLVNPRHGTAATGPAQLQLETAPLNGTGPDETVLAAVMNQDFAIFQNVSFPVYTLSTGRGHERGYWRHHRGYRRHHGRDDDSVCQGTCAVYWPPVLTSTWPEASQGIDQRALGTIWTPEGQQVTYHGRPLYFYNKDAYIGPVGIGTVGIYGSDVSTPWGVFHTVPRF